MTLDKGKATHTHLVQCRYTLTQNTRRVETRHGAYVCLAPSVTGCLPVCGSRGRVDLWCRMQ